MVSDGATCKMSNTANKEGFSNGQDNDDDDDDDEEEEADSEEDTDGEDDSEAYDEFYDDTGNFAYIMGSTFPRPKVNIDHEYTAVVTDVRHPRSISLRIDEGGFLEAQKDIDDKIKEYIGEGGKCPEKIDLGDTCLAKSGVEETGSTEDGVWQRGIVLALDDNPESAEVSLDWSQATPP